MTQPYTPNSPYGARKKKGRTPPRGWRRLAVGEQIQAADQVWFRSRWEPVMPSEIGRRIHPYSFVYVRKEAAP
jgi:hypothetical protein